MCMQGEPTRDGAKEQTVRQRATLQKRSWAVPFIGCAAISPKWLREEKAGFA